MVEVDTFRIRKELELEHEAREGSFGVVLSSEIRGEGRRCWGKIPGIGDLCFQASAGRQRVPLGSALSTDDAEARLRSGLSGFERFVEYVARSSRSDTGRRPASRLAEALRWNPAIGKTIGQYVRRAEEEEELEVNATRRKQLSEVVRAGNNLGVGSLAIVAPEGPHAIAGGLAQVVVGLTSVFDALGIETTIISPLYEDAQGSKHRSAKEVLAEGISLHGKKCPIQLRGTIRVPFGPEFASGSSRIVRNAMIAMVEVFEAKDKHTRIIFLRHRILADKLYAAADSNDQIRRAIFLSRGALEVLRDERFSVSADAVITNDWLTGLVPVYLNAHPRYSQHPRLKSLPVVHMLHNCGQVYQGRFYTNQYGQDLWPVFDLADEHFFGISDPADRRFLNLTGAAVRHTTGALLAVSKPYAEALLTEAGSEGLQELFQAKKKILFGISNGIDLSGLRKFTWQVGEQASQTLGRKTPVLARYRSDSLVSRLAEYKISSKQVVQRARGLDENPQATLISLVGRLAEQKGIRLLAAPGLFGAKSVIESVLEEFPCAQFLFAGPLAANDPAARLFQRVVEDLVVRFPGRVQRAFTFLPHREALEITLGSNIFLMPSRYEPGGITQLEALACGTPVVARRIGGLAATIEDYNPAARSGTGFLFEKYTPEAFHRVLRAAIVLIGDSHHRNALLRSGALAENDWSNRSESYLAVLQQIVGVLDARIDLPVLNSRRKALKASRPA